jgi:hypothetical protein
MGEMKNTYGDKTRALQHRVSALLPTGASAIVHPLTSPTTGATYVVLEIGSYDRRPWYTGTAYIPTEGKDEEIANAIESATLTLVGPVHYPASARIEVNM